MWYIKEKDNYLWVTNDAQSLKIGKKDKKYSKRIAAHEVDRRNKGDVTSFIEFSEKDIKKMIF